MTTTAAASCTGDENGTIIKQRRTSHDDDGLMIHTTTSSWEPSLENSTTSTQPCSSSAASNLRYVPRCLRFDNSPPEATGLSIDFYARAMVLMSSIFMGPALLQLSTEAANCDNEQDCTSRIMGMRPSSLLSNIAVASGILNALTMPIFGAVVDHTSYRLQIGKYSGYVLAITKGIEAMVSSKTWPIVAGLQVFSGLLYCIHIVATYAYTSELSKDSAQQTKYNTYFFMVLYASTLLFLAQVLAVSFLFDSDDVGTARISQLLTCITSGILFVISWTWLFRERPLSSRLPNGSSLWTIGFVKVARTSVEICMHMPSLKRLMGAILLGEAASNALVTVATTYMSTFLDLTSTEIGCAFLSVLVMGIPGAKTGQWVALYLNPLASAKLCVTIFILNTVMASILLTGPEHGHFIFIFCAIWGMCLGWLHPMHTVLFLGLAPSTTEYMGIYIFCQQVLSWVPPLVFTVMNEAGVEMNIGMASLSLFFVIELLFLQSMGNFNALVVVDPPSAGVQSIELPSHTME